MPKKKATVIDETQLMRPALSPDAREKQLTALAYDLVEQRLRDGTATSQETTYFLKAYGRKAQLEQEVLELNKELIKAKTSQIRSAEVTEKLYANAIKAFGIYSGKDHVEED